jgi:hypothetical protein
MKTLFAAFITIVFVLTPLIAIAQNYSAGGQAPLAQPLVREGTLAVRMVEVLKLGTTADEVEAENLLLGAAIAPRNGWISDYPVTPDIVSELRSAVIGAADAGLLTLGRDEAAQAFDGILAEYNLLVNTETSAGAAVEEQAPVYPDNTMVDDYYYDYGPPPVTYYAPPAYYANLYSWVPYPFWGWNAWFPGFFVLSDFHRFVYVDKRVYIVSNHFYDKREHRYSRIDARARFREFHDKRFDDRGRRFVNKRVIGPSEVRREVRKEAERGFVAEPRRVRTDVDRSRTNFSGSREIRGGTREVRREMRRDTEVKRENRTFTFPGRREGPVVAPSEKSRPVSRPPESTFRPAFDRGGHRELNSAPRTFNSRPVIAPSSGGRVISPRTSHRSSGPSVSGMRGGSMGGSFGRSGQGHRR